MIGARRAALASALCAALWSPVGATAQDTEAPDVVEARALFGRGLVAHDRGDDATAERLFRRSIALRPSASALFNLATLLDERGEVVEALQLYRRVDASEGVPAEVRSHAQQRIVALAPRLAERVEEAEARGSEARLVAVPIDTPRGPDLTGPGLLLGGGGAVLIAGAITGSVSLVWHEELLAHCMDNPCADEDDARIPNGRALALATDVLLPVGAAVAAAGLIWLVVALTEGASTDVACGAGACGARVRF